MFNIRLLYFQWYILIVSYVVVFLSYILLLKIHLDIKSPLTLSHHIIYSFTSFTTWRYFLMSAGMTFVILTVCSFVSVRYSLISLLTDYVASICHLLLHYINSLMVNLTMSSSYILLSYHLTGRG